MTDEPKNPLKPDADLHPVDDLEAIDVPDAPEHFDELVDADLEKPVETPESAELPQTPGKEKPDAGADDATEEEAVTVAEGRSVDSPEADSLSSGTSEKTPEDTAEKAPGDTSGGGEGRPVRDIYEVTGRARPQWIMPKASADSGSGSAGDSGPESPESPAVPVVEPEADETRTTVFSAGGVGSREAGTDFDGSSSTDSTDATAAPNLSENPSGNLSENPEEETTTQVFDSRAASTTAPAGAVVGAGYAQSEETEFLGGPLTSDAQFSGAIGDPEGLFPEDAATQDNALHPALETAGEATVASTAPRGTLDLGLLLLRILVGVPLILRGLQTLFSFGGDPGIDALEARFGDFSAGDILAITLPTAEVVGGGLLLLGLATPLGGAVSLVSAGFMALFELSLSEAGYWPYQLSQSAQSWAFLGLLGLALIVTGPGRYSADISRAWATRPRASAWLWAIIGVVGMAALWLLVGGGTPF